VPKKYYIRLKKAKTKGILLKLDYEKIFDNVNWNFILEILKTRKFGPKWIKWIEEILNSVQTSISINKQITSYFKCKKGLRQGDHLSPFLFNLVVDTLFKILTKAKEHGYIKGFGNFEGNSLINLIFIDDTLIFL
jgi:Reverse transcriptase (RNA-dependent DNA polymerase)